MILLYRSLYCGTIFLALLDKLSYAEMVFRFCDRIVIVRINETAYYAEN